MRIRSPWQRPSAVTARMRTTWTRWDEAVQEAERVSESMLLLMVMS
jgi:hypothetical protein